MTGTPPQPDSAAAGAGTRKSSSPTSLAWLVHSQDSISRCLPPDIDDKPLVRQRRRRTSPEDQKILEAEYQRNPRPDKATRMSIVNRVALGEKEVQIWFQNRRQNSRRKAQPLTADDILNRLQPSSDGPSAASDVSFSENNEAEENKENTPVIESGKAGVTFAIEREQAKEGETPLTPEGPSAGVRHNEATETQTTVDASQATIDHPPSSTAPTELSASQSFLSSQDANASSSMKPGYLANRRSASFLLASDGPAPTASMSQPAGEGAKLGYLSNRRSASFVQPLGEGFVQPASQPPRDDEQSLKRSSSILRLSMTWDGKAKVIGNASPTPSPPRTQPQPVAVAPIALPALRRSHSAVGLSGKPKPERLDAVGRRFQRTASGRSHDSRAWEFWCDSDARNSLAEKAEQESSGSAADAIGLMRSNSRTAAAAKAGVGRKRVLQPSNQGNAAVPSKRSKFSRATTATGRLPTETRKLPDGKEGKEGSEEAEKPCTDSDKENWEPSNPGVQLLRRPQGVPFNRGRRAMLGENTLVPSHSSSLGAMMERDRGRQPKLGREDSENIQPYIDDEVSSFMGGSSERGSSARTSLSSGEDLDCVQGLLSLSQGIWN